MSTILDDEHTNGREKDNIQHTHYDICKSNIYQYKEHSSSNFDTSCHSCNQHSVIKSEASFRRPVTAAIDITTVPYYGDVDGMPMVSGLDQENRAFKFATLSIVGLNIPLVLAVEPVQESSAWDDNAPNQVYRVVRRLVRRAKKHVSIETVLCDREFDSMRVFQTLSNPGVNYLIPKRITNSEQNVLDHLEEDDQEVAVESASVHVETGSNPMRFLYVPSTKGEGMAVFATNMQVGPDEAEAFCHRYSRRWQIENEYKSIKGDFLVKTSSKDYRIRLFYFVFAVLLYNIWRLTDFLLKAGIDGEMDYAPVLTAASLSSIEWFSSSTTSDFGRTPGVEKSRSWASLTTK